MVAFIQLIGKGAEKRTRYSQNIMNVKVKMAGGGGGACLGLWHRTFPPPPHTTQVNCFGRLHCAGGGRRERRTMIEIKKLDIKNTLLLLPPSLSNGASLVQNSKFN